MNIELPLLRSIKSSDLSASVLYALPLLVFTGELSLLFPKATYLLLLRYCSWNCFLSLWQYEFFLLSNESPCMLEYIPSSSKQAIKQALPWPHKLFFLSFYSKNSSKDCPCLLSLLFPLSILLEHFNKNFIFTMTRKQLLPGCHQWSFFIFCFMWISAMLTSGSLPSWNSFFTWILEHLTSLISLQLY